MANALSQRCRLTPRVIGDVKEDPKEPRSVPRNTRVSQPPRTDLRLRFGLETFVEPSTRSGRRFARVTGGASIVDVVPIDGSEIILAVSRACRAMICAAEEINYLSGPGKGVTLIRLACG